MADTQVFFLGATGFVGATVFDLIYAKHPEYRFTALVRSNEKATDLINRYPLVHVIIGDANNTDLIQKESAKANIVISIFELFPFPNFRYH
jgi:1-deoxy-D-xylulose 5-phosphate reductoisomerase